MGAMPPLGGTMAPVGRLVRMKSAVQNGDVVVVTTGETTNGTAEQSCPDCDPNELYAKGVLGIISDMPVCPWDGRFSLQVDDMNVTQQTILEFVRDRIDRPVVAVLGNEHGVVADALRTRFERTLNPTTDAAKLERQESSDALWQVLATATDADAIIANVGSDESNEVLSALCPTIVVATAAATVIEILKVIDLAAPNGILVLEDSEMDGSKPPRVVEVSQRLRKGWTAAGVSDGPADGIHTKLIGVATKTIAETIERKTTNQARVA